MIFLWPFIDKMVKMDLRVVTIDVAKQEVMTRDNVPVFVDAVVYFVWWTQQPRHQSGEFWKATSLIAQMTLRSVLGQADGRAAGARDKSISTCRRSLTRQTDPWGIKVTAVEVKTSPCRTG